MIDSGALTNKPIEYSSLIKHADDRALVRDYDGTYIYITKILDHLLPIRDYKSRAVLDAGTPRAFVCPAAAAR